MLEINYYSKRKLMKTKFINYLIIFSLITPVLTAYAQTDNYMTVPPGTYTCPTTAEVSAAIAEPTFTCRDHRHQQVCSPNIKSITKDNIEYVNDASSPTNKALPSLAIYKLVKVELVPWSNKSGYAMECRYSSNLSDNSSGWSISMGSSYPSPFPPNCYLSGQTVICPK